MSLSIWVSTLKSYSLPFMDVEIKRLSKAELELEFPKQLLKLPEGLITMPLPFESFGVGPSELVTKWFCYEAKIWDLDAEKSCPAPKFMQLLIVSRRGRTQTANFWSWRSLRCP